MLFGKGLNGIMYHRDTLTLVTKPQNLRLVQVESICRRQIDVNEKLKFGLGRIKNIVRKEENAGYPQCSQKLLFKVV